MYLDVQAVALLFKELVRDAKVAETVVESNIALSGLRDKVKLVVAATLSLAVLIAVLVAVPLRVLALLGCVLQ